MTRRTRTLVLAVASVGITAGAMAGAVQAQAGVVDRYEVTAREMAPISQWANQQGLAGLSPASLGPVGPPQARPTSAAPVSSSAPVTEYARDVFADIPLASQYPRDVFAAIRD
jgi:hypothetical protein